MILFYFILFSPESRIILSRRVRTLSRELQKLLTGRQPDQFLTAPSDKVCLSYIGDELVNISQRTKLQFRDGMDGKRVNRIQLSRKAVK